MEYAVDAATVGLVVGLVSLAKSMDFPSKYAGLLALVLGVLVVVGHTGLPVSIDSIYVGVASGLAASGLYSGTKAVTQ